jgi:hypothetical protein
VRVVDALRPAGLAAPCALTDPYDAVGLPIDSFEVLQRVRDGHVPSDLLKALRSFRLFAIVMHDPRLHAAFHRRLTEEFEVLDEATGEHLLFFALVPSPHAWQNAAAARPYVAAFERLRDRIGYGPTGLVGDEHVPSDTLAEALGLASGIELGDLPCILVLRDLASADVLAVHSDEETIGDQLRVIGDAARRSLDLDKLRAQFRTTTIERAEVHVAPAHPVVGAIADVLSTTVRNASGRGPIAANAAAVMLQALRTANKQWRAARREAGDAEHEDLAASVDRTARFLLDLVVLATTTGATDPMQLVDERYLEPESRTWISTALHFVANSVAGLENPPTALAPFLDDFGPCAFNLGKALENEVNRSIAQEIRRRLGVPMPSYYDKHWPDAGQLGYTCNMNTRGRHISWQSPGLGRVLAEARNGRNSPPPYLDEQLDSFAFERMQRIKEFRDRAAHPPMILRPTEFDDMQRSFAELAARRFFERTHAMKMTLRGLSPATPS